MQKMAALRADVFSLSAKTVGGGLINPPPIRAQVNVLDYKVYFLAFLLSLDMWMGIITVSALLQC